MVKPVLQPVGYEYLLPCKDVLCGVHHHRLSVPSQLGVDSAVVARVVGERPESLEGVTVDKASVWDLEEVAPAIGGGVVHEVPCVLADRRLGAGPDGLGGEEPPPSVG